MPHPMRSVPAYVPEALAASNVGTWKTGSTINHYITDAAAAAMFGLNAEEAASGVALARFSQAIHPADRGLFHDRLDRVTAHGGLFVIEYRTAPCSGQLRWVLARGRYERDLSTGVMSGRGILIDITESKLDGHVEDRALFVEPQTNEDHLDRAADFALRTRHAIDEIDDQEGLTLRCAVDQLLLMLGHALAKRITRSFN